MSGTTTTQGTDRRPRRWRFVALASSLTLALAGLVGLGSASAASADTLPVCPDTTVVVDTVDGITSTLTVDWTLSGNICIAEIMTVYTRAANPAVLPTCEPGYTYDTELKLCTKPSYTGTWDEKLQKTVACWGAILGWEPFQDPDQATGWNCGRWQGDNWVTDPGLLRDPLFKHEAWIQKCPSGGSPEVHLTCTDDPPPAFQCVFPTMTPTGGTDENCYFDGARSTSSFEWSGPVDGICSRTTEEGDEMTATCPVAGDVLTDGSCVTPAGAKFGREGGAAQFCLTTGPVVVSWDGVSGYGTQLDADAAATTVKANALAAAAVPAGTPEGACLAAAAVAPEVVAPAEIVAPAPATVAAPAAATVAAPAPAAVSAGVAGTAAVADTATVPSAIPAGGGSQAPTMPIWALAMIVVGFLGAAGSAYRFRSSSQA